MLALLQKATHNCDCIKFTVKEVRLKESYSQVQLKLFAHTLSL